VRAAVHQPDAAGNQGAGSEDLWRQRLGQHQGGERQADEGADRADLAQVDRAGQLLQHEVEDVEQREDRRLADEEGRGGEAPGGGLQGNAGGQHADEQGEAADQQHAGRERQRIGALGPVEAAIEVADGQHQRRGERRQQPGRGFHTEGGVAEGDDERAGEAQQHAGEALALQALQAD
jgi:hypothetical protein